MIELVTVDGFARPDLRTAWESLAGADPAATVFHTPRYLEAWHRVLGQRITPRIHLVLRDGTPIGVVPEAHERQGSPTGPIELRRFLGGEDVTDYLGPVSRPEDRDAVAAAYLEALAVDRDWDELVAAGLAADSGWVEALARHVDAAGLTVLEDAVEDVCPRVDLADGYDAHLERLGGKRRHELRRKARRLAREAGEVRVVDVRADDLDDGIERFLDLATAGEDAKSRFFLNDDRRQFFHALAKEFGGDRILRLHVLEVGGAPAAATVSLVHGGQWGLYNSAFDADLAHLSPGMVLVGELIAEAAAEGLHTFDLLRGDEPYKYRFGAVDRPLRRLTVARRPER